MQPKHSNCSANLFISSRKASAYGSACKVSDRLLASLFFFRHFLDISSAFCSGVKGPSASAVFLAFFGFGSSGTSDWAGVLGAGVPGADGLAEDESSSCLLVGLVVGGFIVLMLSKTN